MTTQTINSNYPTSNTKKTIYCGGLAEEVDEKVSIYCYCTTKHFKILQYKIIDARIFGHVSMLFLGSKGGFYTFR